VGATSEQPARKTRFACGEVSAAVTRAGQIAEGRRKLRPRVALELHQERIVALGLLVGFRCDLAHSTDEQTENEEDEERKREHVFSTPTLPSLKKHRRVFGPGREGLQLSEEQRTKPDVAEGRRGAKPLRGVWFVVRRMLRSPGSWLVVDGAEQDAVYTTPC
jgi:hypothetical protein